MKDFKDFLEEVSIERARIGKVSATMQGLGAIGDAYFKQFGHKYVGLESAVSELARVNVIRRGRGDLALI